MLVSPAHKKSWLLKLLLYPLVWIYGLAIGFRHFIYNNGFKKSIQFNFPVIVVGNLSLGGSGKTPFTAYLCTMLSKEYQLATLSRGYKRKSVGYNEVQSDSLPSEVGDEPYWLKMHHPDTRVYVGEDRVLSISYLLQDQPFLDAIILDDAFQHRKLNAGMNILLSEFSNLYTDDELLPVGYLRDLKSAAKRANIIVITKCPTGSLNNKTKEEILEKINLSKTQNLFFATIVYKQPIPIVANEYNFISFNHQNVLLVTGIANPEPLIKELENKRARVTHLKYSDHYDFAYENVIQIITTFDKMSSPKLIVCTEKDSVKFMRFKKYWKHLPIFIIPVETKIIQEEERFLQLVKNYIESY